jgi:hypothetical protein
MFTSYTPDQRRLRYQTGVGSIHREEKKMRSKWGKIKRVKCFVDLEANGRMKSNRSSKEEKK